MSDWEITDVVLVGDEVTFTCDVPGGATVKCADLPVEVLREVLRRVDACAVRERVPWYAVDHTRRLAAFPDVAISGIRWQDADTANGPAYLDDSEMAVVAVHDPAIGWDGSGTVEVLATQRPEPVAHSLARSMCTGGYNATWIFECTCGWSGRDGNHGNLTNRFEAHKAAT